jgi:putative SbcD/Mre11-related phosphoesterase
MNLTDGNTKSLVEPQPVLNKPALTVGNTLVVADLHIGIEYELSLSGIHVPSQIERRIERVLGFLSEVKARRVVLLGDIKHCVSKTSPLERHDVPHFLRSLAERVPIDILPGNHDGGIEYLIPRNTRFGIEIHRSKGCNINNVALIHGHTWPSLELLSCDYVIVGHNHPVVRLADPLGYVSIKPVWIRARFNEGILRQRFPELGLFNNPGVIIMPAFNELVGGISFNEASYETLLGPLFSNRAILLDKAQAYLLDGTFLGTVEQLRELAPDSYRVRKSSSRRKSKKN